MDVYLKWYHCVLLAVPPVGSLIWVLVAWIRARRLPPPSGKRLYFTRPQPRTGYVTLSDKNSDVFAIRCKDLHSLGTPEDILRRLRQAYRHVQPVQMESRLDKWFYFSIGHFNLTSRTKWRICRFFEQKMRSKKERLVG